MAERQWQPTNITRRIFIELHELVGIAFQLQQAMCVMVSSGMVKECGVNTEWQATWQPAVSCGVTKKAYLLVKPINRVIMAIHAQLESIPCHVSHVIRVFGSGVASFC